MGDERKEPLRLVNGKFMRGNVEEKPEIGNVEQIVLLQRKEMALQEQEKNGIEVEATPKNIHYDVDYQFFCICGNLIHDEECLCSADDVYELDDCVDELDGVETTCERCGSRYEIQGGFAKLITN